MPKFASGAAIPGFFHISALKSHIFALSKLLFVCFRRGGLRATAGGRLGWSTNNQTLSKKPFSDWSLEVLCVWMDSLGIGKYEIFL